MSTIDDNALQLVKQDLELRSSELEINRVRAQQDAQTKQLEINRNADIADKSIAANLEVERARKDAYEKTLKANHLTLRIGIAALIIFIVAAFYFGEKDMVTEVFKTIAAILGPAFGAYFYGKSKTNN
ncbi:hypothetical protein [Thiomicrospira microaerophila]|uniref:hypothetical protein n=1 Tax=Thiomicrospira microaerophila TaxID=406020 RepID=UPI0005C93C1B|nr:hypothetical protein [Thiomicrospira microaerophila]